MFVLLYGKNTLQNLPTYDPRCEVWKTQFTFFQADFHCVNGFFCKVLISYLCRKLCCVKVHHCGELFLFRITKFNVS